MYAHMLTNQNINLDISLLNVESETQKESFNKRLKVKNTKFNHSD